MFKWEWWAKQRTKYSTASVQFMKNSTSSRSGSYIVHTMCLDPNTKHTLTDEDEKKSFALNFSFHISNDFFPVRCSTCQMFRMIKSTLSFKRTRDQWRLFLPVKKRKKAIDKICTESEVTSFLRYVMRSNNCHIEMKNDSVQFYKLQTHIEYWAHIVQFPKIIRVTWRVTRQSTQRTFMNLINKIYRLETLNIWTILKALSIVMQTNVVKKGERNWN